MSELKIKIDDEKTLKIKTPEDHGSKLLAVPQERLQGKSIANLEYIFLFIVRLTASAH
jgi:hypothetical protein